MRTKPFLNNTALIDSSLVSGLKSLLVYCSPNPTYVLGIRLWTKISGLWKTNLFNLLKMPYNLSTLL